MATGDVVSRGGTAWQVMTPAASGVVLALVALELVPPLPNGSWLEVAVATTCAAAATGSAIMGAGFAGWTTIWWAAPATVFALAVVPVDLFAANAQLHEVLNPLAAAGCVLALVATASGPGRAWPLIRVGLGAAASVHLLGPLIAPHQVVLVYLGAVVVLFVGAMGLLWERGRRTGELARVGDEVFRAQRERDHEIRNILSGLSGASHLLGGSRTGLSPEERDAVRKAFDAEVDRLWALLDLKRSGATRPRALHEPIDVVAVVREVADLWAVGGRLAFSTDQPMVWANCSPAVLKQAMTNCLANCARYAPGANVTISVSTRAMRARVEIADDGPGPGRTIAYSLDSASTGDKRSSVGLGIGLQDTARVLGYYGGTVTLRPGPAGGAVAEIEIPSVAADAPFVTFRAS